MRSDRTDTLLKNSPALEIMSHITVEHIADAGVVGAGGAGFPTHVKLAARADTVLINAAECEPLLHKDKEVLREYADAVIEGMAVAMRLVGADRAVIGIKEKYDDVIAMLRAKLPQKMDVAVLRDAYPAGDELIMVYDVLGRVIPPGGIPLAVGAVVLNVETAVNVAAATRLRASSAAAWTPARTSATLPVIRQSPLPPRAMAM